ncbi:MAG: BNR repeat-containing protein [Tepidisphaeraceae bacterium]
MLKRLLLTPRLRAMAGTGVVMMSLTGIAAAADVQLVRNTVVDPRGTTMAKDATYGEAINGLSFQGHAITSFKGYQYAVFYVTDAVTTPQAHVAISRRKLPDGAWQTIDLRDSVFKNGVRKGTNEPFDAHNVASIGICPADGTLHLAYDHHNHTLRYRVTKPGVASDPDHTTWDASLFEPERSSLVHGQAVTQVSYPDFEQTPSGGLQMFMRRGGSGHGSWWLWNYDPSDHQWKSGWQYDDGMVGAYDAFSPPSLTRCAYPNGYTYGRDGKLHISFTWREGGGAPSQGANGCNHDICYVYSTDGGRSWKNNSGQTVGDQDAAGGPTRFNLTSPGLTVVPVTQLESMINEQAQAVDGAGQMHILMYRLDPMKGNPYAGAPVWRTEDCSYFHTWRSPDGTWKESKIPAVVGTRPKLAFDRNDDAYAVFTTGPTPGLRAVNRHLAIATASRASQWTDWKVVLTLPGALIGEPLLDTSLLQSDNTLSVFVQDTPTQDRQPTPVRVIDFAVGAKH